MAIPWPSCSSPNRRRGTPARRKLLAKFPELVTLHIMGEGFTWETQDRARDIAAATKGWERAKELIRDDRHRMVLLDELNIVLRYDYLDINEVADFPARGKARRQACRHHRPQRQAGTDRDGRSRHRDDAGEASVPRRREGARRASSSDAAADTRADDPGHRLQCRQVDDRRGARARAGAARPEGRAVQAAEHVEQCRRRGRGRRDRPRAGRAGAGGAACRPACT